VLEKQIIAQLVKKYLPVVEPEGSLTGSQGLPLIPDLSQINSLLKINFNSVLPSPP
jgi:hypothetical protein